jgi:hypothetical protein
VARSTGPVLLAGGLAAANEAVFAPLAAHQAENWDAVFRIVPATAGLALGLALLEKAAEGFAVGLAWLLVAGVLVFPLGKAPSILTNVNKVLNL